MRFSFKIFFSSMVVIAIAMGFGGFYLIDSVFSSAISREIRQALDENKIVCVTFQTIALNIPLKYDSLTDKTIKDIAETLETGRFIQISDENNKLFYSGENFNSLNLNLDKAPENKTVCKILKSEKAYFVYTGTMIRSMDKLMYLETLKDISTIFSERASNFSIYQSVTIITLIAGAILMYLLSLWLTKPIKMLTGVTRSMAAGEYGIRAVKISEDEFGLLTDDFNKMANALDEKITELKNEAESKENFVQAFTHELKTPLTAIVGYADLLRSRKMEEEERFLAADYIYREGRRLESLSFNLLDIFVMKKNEHIFKSISVSLIFDFINVTFSPNENANIIINYEDAYIYSEITLITTVLFNLIENAISASIEGGKIEVNGMVSEKGYEFCVRDYGSGISDKDIDKITEAFYMVDKSRKRSRGNTGLGLALIVEILKLHDSKLKIESKLGEGTKICFEISRS